MSGQQSSSFGDWYYDNPRTKEHRYAGTTAGAHAQRNVQPDTGYSWEPVGSPVPGSYSQAGSVGERHHGGTSRGTPSRGGGHDRAAHGGHDGSAHGGHDRAAHGGHERAAHGGLERVAHGGNIATADDLPGYIAGTELTEKERGYDTRPSKHTSGQVEDSRLNYQFFMNQIPSEPYGDFIDNIHRKWWGDYKLLEQHHGFIQWLFPIREYGLNASAHPLTQGDKEGIMSHQSARTRLEISYEMMLDFYGMALNRKTHEISRSANWKKRFEHLNWSSHNYLRISRILKCLGELGFECYKYPFLKFCVREVFKERTLEQAADSCLNHWIPTLESSEQRQELMNMASQYFHNKAPDQKSDKTAFEKFKAFFKVLKL